MKYSIITSENFSNSSSGVNNFITSVCSALDKSEVIYEVIDFGYAISELPILNKIKLPHVLRMIIFLIYYQLFLRKPLGDIIIINRSELIFSKLFTRKKFILFVHGSSKYSQLYWGKILKSVNLIIERVAISISYRIYVLLEREDAGCDYYKTKYPIHCRKIKFMPVYSRLSNTDSLEAMVTKQELEIKEFSSNYQILVGYHGRIINSPKNIDRIFDLAKASYDNKIGFILIGNGPDYESLKKRSLEYDNVLFLGEIENTILAPLLEMVDVGIILSTFEGICISGLDYLKVNRPIVATDVGDINKYIHGNGVLLKRDASDCDIIDAIISAKEIKPMGTPLMYTEAYFENFLNVEMEDW